MEELPITAVRLRINLRSQQWKAGILALILQVKRSSPERRLSQSYTLWMWQTWDSRLTLSLLMGQKHTDQGHKSISSTSVP